MTTPGDGFLERARGVFYRMLWQRGVEVRVRQDGGSPSTLRAIISQAQAGEVRFEDAGSGLQSTLMVTCSSDPDASMWEDALGGIVQPDLDTEIEYQGRWYTVEFWEPYDPSMGGWTMRAAYEQPVSRGAEGAVRR